MSLMLPTQHRNTALSLTGSSSSSASLLFWAGSLMINSALWGYYFRTVWGSSPKEALQHLWSSLMLTQSKDKQQLLLSSEESGYLDDGIPRLIYVDLNYYAQQQPLDELEWDE